MPRYLMHMTETLVYIFDGRPLCHLVERRSSKL